MWESIPAVHTHHGPERLLVSEKHEGTFIGPLLRNVSCGEEVSVAQRWAIARVGTSYAPGLLSATTDVKRQRWASSDVKATTELLQHGLTLVWSLGSHDGPKRTATMKT